MTSSVDISKVRDEVLSKIGIKKMKSKQEDIFNCIMNKEDCFAILPTGYGKSLPYFRLSYTWR